MLVREAADQQEWEAFLDTCEEKTFLHSWEWGEFQTLLRGKVWRFVLENEQGVRAVCLAVAVRAKRGSFLLIPHGPVVRSSVEVTERKQIMREVQKKCRELASAEKMSFIRVNPIWKRTLEHEDIFQELGFRKAPMQMHPEASWKLDISLPEEELFRNMRKTTKQIIRKLQEDPEVEIRRSEDISDVAGFAEMHRVVSLRQKFVPFSKEYLENEFSVFSKQGRISLFHGLYKGKIVATSFVVFWSGIAFYHHAASLQEHAKLSLPYLLQWNAILEAKRRGCTLYDFWGYVDPDKRPKHPWAGPTRFKMGFGGEAHEYVYAQDDPRSFQYWPTALFETIRRVRRGL